MTKPLSPKRQRFVAEFLVDQNGTQAAIRAGYSPRTANEQASQLLAKLSVKSAIQARLTKLTAKAELKAENVLEAIRRNVDAEAFGDLRALYDEKGRLKQIHALTRDESDKVGGFETVIKNAAAGDGHTDTVLKIKVKDHSRYVEMGAKHFKLLTDIVEHQGLEGMELRIRNGRVRIGER